MSSLATPKWMNRATTRRTMSAHQKRRRTRERPSVASRAVCGLASTTGMRVAHRHRWWQPLGSGRGGPLGPGRQGSHGQDVELLVLTKPADLREDRAQPRKHLLG